jgi:hypothetical protein
MANRHPLPILISPAASAEETAAIAAAVERFRAETASTSVSGGGGPDGWQRAAILEGVSRQTHRDVSDPWINT